MSRAAGPDTDVGYAPWRMPVVGHLHLYLRDKIGFLQRSVAEYGRPVKLHIGQPTLLLTDPEDVRHVLVERQINYSKTPRLASAKGRRLFGRGLLTSSPEAHLRQRRLLQRAFTPRAVSQYGDVIVERVRRTIAQITSAREMDLCRTMEELSKSVIVGALLGDGDADRDGALSGAIRDHRAFIEHVYGSWLPLRASLPLPVVNRERRAQRLFRRILEQQIAARRADGIPRADLLQAFLDARYEDESCMPDDLVLDEAITMLSTGYETVGDAMTWAWYLLAINPEVRTRMRQEIRHAIGDQAPEPGDVTRLDCVNRVFSEVLRMYPPTWIFVRVALSDDQLPSGQCVAPGTKIFLCPYVLHRHPGWFPDPECFDPERFSPDAVRTRPRHAFLPFGAGPRVCIGEHLARLEAVLALTMMVQRFDFELLEPAREPTMRAGITLRPKHGLRVRAMLRDTDLPH